MQLYERVYEWVIKKNNSLYRVTYNAEQSGLGEITFSFGFHIEYWFSFKCREKKEYFVE